MTEKESTWFHWERNATFTPIYMCMEAWAEPTLAYWGVAWPTTICVWKNDVISWNNKTLELEAMGKLIVDKLLSTGTAKLENEINATAVKIDSFIKNFDLLDDPIKQFRELHVLYLHWFVLGVT